MEEPAATATAQNPREVSINRARSRSRGRSNPSELLARRQQLLGSESNGGNGWNGSSLADSSTTHQQVSGSDKQRLARAAERRQPVTGGVPEDHSDGRNGRMQSSKSVEARLESLSEMLKSHQMNEQADVELQFSASSRSIDDVYILLAKKEEDLQLAAELGKVLLEKNDELSKANERITEEYSHKLELLEQDKHKLKRQLDLVNGEYENRLIELQADCNILKNQLEEQQQVAKQREKEKSKLIDDLAQQNQRLTSELVEATKSEELLSSQLEQMNERFNVRMSNRQDHVVQLDALKEEIQIVNQRKQDLERRLKLANNDKGNLNAALDESGDKLMLLENLLNERDLKLSEMLEEINELRDSSSWLSNELEAMISLNERLAGSNATSGGSGEHQAQIGSIATAAATSSELNSIGQRKRSQLVEQLRELRLKQRSRLKASELMLIRRRSEARANSARIRPRSARRTSNKTGKKTNALGTSSSLFDEMESSADNDDSSSPNRSPSSRHYDDDDDEEEADYDEQRGDFFPLSGDWKDETLGEIFTLLVRFQQALQQRKDSLTSSATAAAAASAAANQTSLAPTHLYSPNSTTEDSGISADDIDKTSGEQHQHQQQQASDPALWQRLISSLKALIEEMPCSTCRLMIAERADYERLQKLHSRLCDEVRKKDDELLKLQVTKTEQETKLAALEDRCAILSDDLSNCDRPKEEIVQLAWKARDEAVERKNNAEIALAKTRIENMQISSQLMEVVQQKGELSQRLAQFEDDIHHITQHSVKAKFTWEEYTEKLRHSKTAQPDSAGNSHTYHSNPLAQLLNFSVASTRDTNGSTATTTTTSNTANKSSAMDHLSQPVSLMRNLTSNRFNLRFWQRSSAEKSTTADKGSGATTVDAIDNNNSLSSSNNNNSNNSLAEQHTATELSAV